MARIQGVEPPQAGLFVRFIYWLSRRKLGRVIDIGSAVGRTQGISEEKLIALGDFESSSAFSGLEKLVLRYAAGMTSTPVEVSDALFEELRHSFTDRQLVELTSAIAWENYRARFDHAFGIEAEGFSTGAFCPLPSNKR